MATITVRNLDDAVYERLKREAKANHRSLEAEARVRIEHNVAPAAKPQRDWAEEFRRVAIDPGPDYEGSVALIWAIRDEERSSSTLTCVCSKTVSISPSISAIRLAIAATSLWQSTLAAILPLAMSNSATKRSQLTHKSACCPSSDDPD